MLDEMTRLKLHSSLALTGVIAALRIAKAAFGFGGGGDGLIDVAFSAPDAPNSPPRGSTTIGSGGAGSGAPAPTAAPDGHDSWLDFLDWATWTTLKNLLRAPIGFGIEAIEGAPVAYESLNNVKDHHQRLRDSIDTDHRGTSHLTGGNR